MEKTNLKRPDFCLEGFFANSEFIKVRHVAANYFNMAHNNFYKTLLYVLTRSGLDRKFLNSINFQEEKMGEVLQLLCHATFGTEEQKQKILNQYFEQHKTAIKKKDEKHCKSEDDIQKEALQRAENNFSRLVLPSDLQERIRKKLFHLIPAFAPIMADIASYEAYKTRQKSEELKDKNKDKILRGITFRHCLETMALVADALIYYRNFYTHLNPYNDASKERAQAEREAKLVKYMNNVFKACQRLDKKRDLLSTHAMTFLTGHGPNDRMLEVPNGEETYYDNKKKCKVTRKRYKYEENPTFYFRIAGHQYIAEDGWSANCLSDFGKLFFCCLFLKRQQTQLFAKDSRLFEFSPFKLTDKELQAKQQKEHNRVACENKVRKQNGIKREAKSTIFTKEDSPQKEIILDMLGIYHIRKPLEKRIDAKSTSGTLAMDMLNELRRCPSELYLSFSSNDKKLFEREISLPKDGSPQNAKAEEKVKLIRYSDRFSHLALRYIDETKLLGDICFHIRLGNYRFHFYNKICVDGSPKVRVWQKEINGFGKWQKIEEARKTKYAINFQKREYVNTQQEYGEMELEQPVKDTAETEPYITDWTAAYNIHTNRIGLMWGLDDDIYLPDLSTVPESADESKEDNVQKHRAPIDMKKPLCSLCIYDLPALLFYHYLWDTHKGGKFDLPKAEQIIKNAYKGLTAFFDAVKSEEKPEKGKSKCEQLEAILQENDLLLSAIPKKMRKYMEGQAKLTMFNGLNNLKLIESVFGRYDENQEKYVDGKLGEKIEEVAYRIKAFKDKKQKIDSGDNKYAKKGYADIRHGVLARYLAKSFVEWQPTKNEGHDKITGLNYSMMTAFLSTYGISSTLQQLKGMLEKARLIGGNNPHPFLQKVVDSQPQNIETLYLIYLKEEQTFAKSLDKYKKELESFKGNIQDKIKYINKKKREFDELLSQIPFAHANRIKWKPAKSVDSYYKSYAGRYGTIMLPDGLFTDKLIELMRRCFPDDEVLKDRVEKCKTDNRQTLGAAWLIEYYFEHYMKDKHQSFFDSSKFKRAYKPFTIIKQNFVKNQRGGFTNELIPYYNDENELKKKLSYKDEDIHDFVYNRWHGKKKQEEFEAALKSQIKDVRETEKKIRRYRTQDVVLFLSAKDLLTRQLSNDDKLSKEDKETVKKLKEKAENLKLQDFGFEEDFDFLAEGEKSGLGITFDYQYTSKTGKTITITQSGVSLKNYGNIYRVLGDDRFQSLMEGLAEINVSDVTFNDLTTEFANYDEKRSDMFELVHELENKAFVAYKKELTDPDNPVFYIDDNPDKAPKRNNFNSMLNLLKEYGVEDCKIMIDIRNAIGHDYYADIKLLKRTKKKPKRVPNIALLMLHTMNRKKDDSNQIGKKKD